MTQDTKDSETPKIEVSYTASTKDRVVLYSIWITWGFVPFALIWYDAILYGRALLFLAWNGGFLFAVWFTARRFRKRVVNPAAPNPNGPPESG